jgi:hypothetical protein
LLSDLKTCRGWLYRLFIQEQPRKGTIEKGA